LVVDPLLLTDNGFPDQLASFEDRLERQIQKSDPIQRRKATEERPQVPGYLPRQTTEILAPVVPRRVAKLAKFHVRVRQEGV
jgi:hypothetical protein